MTLRPCLECGAITDLGNRCAKHFRRRQQAKPSAAAMGYDQAWRRLRKRVLAEWLEEHGWWCPGYGRDGHPANDLTGDHIVALADGGESVRANVQILCRSCNVRKSHFTVRRNSKEELTSDQSAIEPDADPPPTTTPFWGMR